MNYFSKPFILDDLRGEDIKNDFQGFWRLYFDISLKLNFLNEWSDNLPKFAHK